MLALALAESQVAEAIELSVSEEELDTLLAQVNASDLFTSNSENLDVQNLAQIGADQFIKRRSGNSKFVRGEK